MLFFALPSKMLKPLSFPSKPAFIRTPIFSRLSPFSSATIPPSLQFRRTSQSPLKSFLLSANQVRRAATHKLRCASSSQELVEDIAETGTEAGNADDVLPSVTSASDVVILQTDELASQTIWNQIVEIVKFSGPATGLWLCGPLMSLIDTAVIGQTSSIELAALGPGTVFCDYMGYMFMFLCIATSNMVATSLAQQDEDAVQRQISILLFVGLTSGVAMLLFTIFLGPWALTAFAGPKNAHLVPAANTYVQIRGLAWPANLIGWVTQSASLGMKDSWGPLKALAVASVINLVGDVVLCLYFGYGIAGAAWATMASQVVAAYMMVDALNKKGYSAYSISVPSGGELLQIFEIAAPVFLTIASKVAFYTLLIYSATSMGTHAIAAHQVMSQTFSLFAVWGEPLSQTAQSFMPELIYGVNRNLAKARMLLKSLLIIGASFGLILGVAGAFFPWFFPNIFTPDLQVIREMHKVLIPLGMALSVTACTHSCEGSLLAGKDFNFISLSMTGCFIFGALLVMALSAQGFGLSGCWYALVGFQWSRFSMALRRLLSPNGFLFSEDVDRYDAVKLKAG